MRNSSVVLRMCGAFVMVSALTTISVAQNREKAVISARAGGVNSVVGNVMFTRAAKSQALTAQDDLTAGDLVTTGAASQVEVLLNPGSYLRLAENSAFELADNTLENLRVRLIKGSAIIEAMGLDNTELHITVVTSQARVALVRRGVYRFNADPDSTQLLVRKGRVLVNDDPQSVIKGGMQVTFRTGSFVAAGKLGKQPQDQFEQWSKARANDLAKANEKLLARGFNNDLFRSAFWDWGFSAFNSYGIWAFIPSFRCFTFLPFNYGWSSPYGYSYGLYYDRYDYWLRRGCCGGGYRPVIVNNGSSGGSTGGSSSGGGSAGGSGGSSGGSIGPSRPPTPGPSMPSQAGPRDPDSGSRSINKIKDPIN